MVATKNRNKSLHGRVINFKGIDSFLRNNNGAKAVARQDGSTYAILARNGNCTHFFNSDEQSIRQFIGNAKPDFIPVR